MSISTRRVFGAASAYLFFQISIALTGVSASAAELQFSIQDPVEDTFTDFSIDVIGLTMAFDNTTGDYEIVVETAITNPFLGDFRINVNLFNPDTGTTAQDPAYFQDTVNDFSLLEPATEIVLNGTNSRLLSWDFGDRVASFSEPLDPVLGPPDGTSIFRSAVSGLPKFTPTSNSDTIGDGPPNNGVGVIVPEPGSLVQLSMAAVMLLMSRCARNPNDVSTELQDYRCFFK